MIIFLLFSSTNCSQHHLFLYVLAYSLFLLLPISISTSLSTFIIPKLATFYSFSIHSMPCLCFDLYSYLYSYSYSSSFSYSWSCSFNLFFMSFAPCCGLFFNLDYFCWFFSHCWFIMGLLSSFPLFCVDNHLVLILEECLLHLFMI